jgi:hypothetical protein
VEMWRSLDHYTCRVWVYDLISLPSEISTLGYFQKDMEEYRGIYIMEDMIDTMDMTEDIASMDVSEEVMEDVTAIH